MYYTMAHDGLMARFVQTNATVDRSVVVTDDRSKQKQRFNILSHFSE